MLLVLLVTTIYVLIAFVIITITVLTLQAPYEYNRHPIGTSYRVGDVIHTLDAITPATGTLRADRDPFMLKPDVHNEIKSIIAILVKTCKDTGVHIWATNDTLLGAVRHNGVMPWCDRSTFGFLNVDREQLIGCRERFEREGYRLDLVSDGYVLCVDNFARYPSCRLTAFADRSDELLVCSPLNELGQCTFGHAVNRRLEIHDTSNILPTINLKFEDFTVPCPVKAEECLDQQYSPAVLGAGHGWRSYVDVSMYQHLNNDYTRGIINRFVTIDR
jgi:hypothetical protein